MFTIPGFGVELHRNAHITLRLAAFDDAVVVTATRIEQPLQQGPMSISAVTGADIERRAIDNLTELSRRPPPSGNAALSDPRRPRGLSAAARRLLPVRAAPASVVVGEDSPRCR